MCTILESRVDICLLSKVCSRVFRLWEWTSNANLFSHGCRIIVRWNVDVVHLMVISQSSQALLAKVFHKATNKTIFYFFIYAGNMQSERRILWSELGIQKNFVRGLPWILMGDFNVALNMKDICGFLFFKLFNVKFLELVECYWNINVEGHNMFKVVSKMKILKKPLRKLLHKQGNLHEHVNKLRIKLDTVQKALDSDPDNPILHEEESVYIKAFNEAKLDEEGF
ncbi:3-ketoacyl-CoA synthase 11-like protein [Tanacetum coccineum]